MRLESFIGKATLAVDTAGRTNFPKEFRKVLSEENEGQVVVTILVAPATLVAGLIAVEARIHMYVMASWHVFRESRFNCFVARRLGAFSDAERSYERALELWSQVDDPEERSLGVPIFVPR